MGLSKASHLTTLRLFYDYWLRLFQKLLRLFQPERYDYCSPLLAIGRKPEKSCGGSRQWFRAARRAPAAGLPRRVERASRCTVTAGRCQIASRRDDPAGLAWYAICYTVLHGSTTRAHRYAFIYLIIIGRLCWPVQRPGVALVSGICWRRCGAVIRSGVAQAVL